MLTFGIIMHPCALMQGKPPFNHLESTSSEFDFPSHPCSQFPFITFSRAGKNNNGKGRAEPHERRSDTQPSHTQRHWALHPTSIYPKEKRGEGGVITRGKIPI